MTFWHAPHSFPHWLALLAVFAIVFGGIPTLVEQFRYTRNPMATLCLIAFLVVGAFFGWMHP